MTDGARTQSEPSRPAPMAWGPLLLFGAISIAFHLAIAGSYGWMRDEMYYVEAGKHLSGGYVEFPAMIALLADLQRLLFGTSLFAIHVLPAFAGTPIILLTGLMARELGGGRTAQIVAGLATLVAPVFVGADALFTMDAFDEIWWALAALLFIKLLGTYDPVVENTDPTASRRNLWLLLGLTCGLGLITKLTIAVLGLAVVIGLLFSGARRELTTPWPYIGGIIAFAFLIPYVMWNAANDWPTIAFWHTYSHGEDAPKFLVETFLLLQPLSIGLWASGLWRLLRNANAKPYRPVAVMWLVLLVLFLVGHGKSYFFAPAFPALLAAGAVSLEELAARRPRLHAVGLTAAALIAGGILLAPVVAPILPPKALASVDASPIQPIADKFGWPQILQAIAGAYRGLPTEQRSHAVILAGNYGEAADLALFGGRYHLPPVLSPQNTFWFWGKDVTVRGPVIAMDIPESTLKKNFMSISSAGIFRSEDGIQNEEVGRHVYICSGFRQPWSVIWQRLQNFS